MKHCPKCQAETERNKRGDCKPCARASCAAWQKANPERQRARSAAWYAANPEKCNAYGAAWYKANSERKKATNAAWYVANTDRVKATCSARKAANPEKAKATSAAWRKENPERHKASCAAYRAANPEKVKASGAAWKKANPEKHKAYNAAWAKANPEALRIFNQNRRARKHANGGELSKGLSAKLFKLQRGLCPCCNKPLGEDYHLDHIMPIDLGGANEDWNIQLLRQRCNNQKSAKHPVAFMQSRGFLL